MNISHFDVPPALVNIQIWNNLTDIPHPPVASPPGNTAQAQQALFDARSIHQGFITSIADVLNRCNTHTLRQKHSGICNIIWIISEMVAGHTTT